MTNEVVLFELELAYRFLLGDMAVRLLHKTYVYGKETWEESLLQGTTFYFFLKKIFKLCLVFYNSHDSCVYFFFI